MKPQKLNIMNIEDLEQKEVMDINGGSEFSEAVFYCLGFLVGNSGPPHYIVGTR